MWSSPFSPDSDSYGVVTSNSNELAAHAFETGSAGAECCELAVRVVEQGAGAGCCGGAGCGAGVGCCELAARVWRQSAGPGCWCWVNWRCRCWAPVWVLAVRMVETGCQCWVLVLGAVSWLCAWWKQGAGCWVCAWWRLGAGAGCCELACRCWVLVLAVVEIECRVLVPAVCVVETCHAVLRRLFQCKKGSCQRSPEKFFACLRYLGSMLVLCSDG